MTFHESNIVRSLFGTHLIHGKTDRPVLLRSFNVCLLGCSVTVGPAEPKSKPSTIGDYPSTALKRAKADHHGLRTFNAYGNSSTHAAHYHQYGHSNNADIIHTFFQQYGTTTTTNNISGKGPYSNGQQQSYWTATSHEDPANLWQQQQHYR